MYNRLCSGFLSMMISLYVACFILLCWFGGLGNAGVTKRLSTRPPITTTPPADTFCMLTVCHDGATCIDTRGGSSGYCRCRLGFKYDRQHQRCLASGVVFEPTTELTLPETTTEKIYYDTFCMLTFCPDDATCVDSDEGSSGYCMCEDGYIYDDYTNKCKSSTTTGPPTVITTTKIYHDTFCMLTFCPDDATCVDSDEGSSGYCMCEDGYIYDDYTNKCKAARTTGPPSTTTKIHYDTYCMLIYCRDGSTCVETGDGSSGYCKCRPGYFYDDENLKCRPFTTANFETTPVMTTTPRIIADTFCMLTFCPDDATCVDSDEGSSGYCMCEDGYIYDDYTNKCKAARTTGPPSTTTKIHYDTYCMLIYCRDGSTCVETGDGSSGYCKCRPGYFYDDGNLKCRPFTTTNFETTVMTTTPRIIADTWCFLVGCRDGAKCIDKNGGSSGICKCPGNGVYVGGTCRHPTTTTARRTTTPST